MAEDHHDPESATTDHEHGRSHGYTDAGSHALPGGLTVAANGLRLETSDTRIDSGAELEWSYEVRDGEGVVTEFEETHDRLAHLILVRRDLTRFQHLHPHLGEDGTWSVAFALPDPGAYRAFVDVLVEGRPTTLGVDLLASGPADYETRPGSTREASADGYDVAMTPESVPPDENVTLEFEIRDDGDAVSLEPYLGALGRTLRTTGSHLGSIRTTGARSDASRPINALRAFLRY